MNNSTSNFYFDRYEETTLDPGWSLVVGSVLASILLHLTLPCILSLGSRYEISKNKNGKYPITTTDASLAGGNSSLKKSSHRNENIIHLRPDLRAPNDGRAATTKLEGEKKHKASKRKGDRHKFLESVKEDEQTSSSSKLSSSLSTNDDRENKRLVSNIPLRKAKAPRLQNKKTKKAPASIVYSIGSQITRSSKGDSSVFSNRPGRQPGLKRNIHKTVNGSSGRRSKRTKRKGSKGIDRQSQAGDDGADCGISMGGSAMSQLHYDDVSFTEAIDSYNRNATQYIAPKMERSGGGGGGEVDILFGDNAWWKPSTIMSAFERIIDIADYDDEFTKIVDLACPYSLQNFVTGIFNVIDIALVCHLYGGSEVNVFVVVPMLTWITNTLNYGFCEALGKTIPEATAMMMDDNSSKDNNNNNKKKYRGKTQQQKQYHLDKLSGKYLNTSLSLYTFGMIPTVIIWSLCTKQIFLWFGFDESTATIAQEYAFIQICSEWISGLEYCIHLFLDLIGHEKYGVYTMFIQNFGQTISIILPKLLFVEGGQQHKHLLLYVGYFRVMILGILMFVDTCIILYHGWIESFASGFFAIPFQDWEVVETIASKASLLGVSYFLTYGQWELLVFFASELGTAEIVTWGMLGHIFSAMKYISDGIADAAESRCALHLVSDEPELARRSAYKSLFLGLVSSVFVTSILFMLGEQIVPLITPDPTLQMLLLEVFPLLGIGHIFVTSGTISWALVGAQGRYNLATIVHFIGSWGVTFPLSCIFIFAIRIDLQGLASAVVMGLAVSSAGNLYILLRSQWERISDYSYTGDENSDESTMESSLFDEGSAGDVISIGRPMWSSFRPPTTTTTRNNNNASLEGQQHQYHRRHVSAFDTSSSSTLQRIKSYMDDSSSVAMSSVTGYTR